MVCFLNSSGSDKFMQKKVRKKMWFDLVVVNVVRERELTNE